MSRITALLVLLPAGLFSGCGENAKVCTQAACEDGIFLTLAAEGGTAVSSFSGDVTLDGMTFTVTCVDGSGGDDRYICLANTLQLRVETADELSLNIRSADDPRLAYIGAVVLDFQEVRPNGEDCEPVCHQANTTIELVPTQA